MVISFHIKYILKLLVLRPFWPWPFYINQMFSLFDINILNKSNSLQLNIFSVFWKIFLNQFFMKKYYFESAKCFVKLNNHLSQFYCKSDVMFVVVWFISVFTHPLVIFSYKHSYQGNLPCTLLHVAFPLFFIANPFSSCIMLHWGNINFHFVFFYY